MYLLGSKGEDVLFCFNLTNEEVENYNDVAARFNTYFDVRTNVLFLIVLISMILTLLTISSQECILKSLSVVMAICATRC